VNLSPFPEKYFTGIKVQIHLIHVSKILEPLYYYHTQRPHQGLGNVPLNHKESLQHLDETEPLGEIVCYESLGGLIKHFERVAA
jgi:hypothetical protein